ncbi:MAG: hypothetical protein K2P84_03565 [Undibacterium sp.]|nr:hypothetical protein [Undibacterium sp.]
MGVDTGYTGLALAVRWQGHSLIELRLQRGTDVTQPTTSCYQTTSLIVASRDGSTRTGQTDEQAIEIAIREKHKDFVDMMLAVGAKPRPSKDNPNADMK